MGDLRQGQYPQILMPQRRTIQHYPALTPIRQVLVHQMRKALVLTRLQQVDQLVRAATSIETP